MNFRYPTTAPVARPATLSIVDLLASVDADAVPGDEDASDKKTPPAPRHRWPDKACVEGLIEILKDVKSEHEQLVVARRVHTGQDLTEEASAALLRNVIRRNDNLVEFCSGLIDKGVSTGSIQASIDGVLSRRKCAIEMIASLRI